MKDKNFADWIKHPFTILLIVLNFITVFIAYNIYVESHIYKQQEELNNKLEKFRNECIDFDDNGKLFTYTKKSNEKCKAKDELEKKWKTIFPKSNMQ